MKNNLKLTTDLARLFSSNYVYIKRMGRGWNYLFKSTTGDQGVMSIYIWHTLRNKRKDMFNFIVWKDGCPTSSIQPSNGRCFLKVIHHACNSSCILGSIRRKMLAVEHSSFIGSLCAVFLKSFFSLFLQKQIFFYCIEEMVDTLLIKLRTALYLKGYKCCFGRLGDMSVIW